ncbi:GNAT family N-acetyltransferase [Tyzzerella sp. OttesenSCG-928-J15]|nr:GNAT family N-acetyltransferase [Tyzzerella sp. OttesenSCG-928-J15]
MITYTNNINLISADMLGKFFVGWQKPLTAAEHYDILKRSYSFVAAIDGESGSVVGFITALSDGLLTAYVSLLEVLPEYQNQGIGAELMQIMFKTLEHVRNIDLVCDEKLAGFYEKFDMHKYNSMIIRK